MTVTVKNFKNLLRLSAGLLLVVTIPFWSPIVFGAIARSALIATSVITGVGGVR